jgi:hypothetical protein
MSSVLGRCDQSGHRREALRKRVGIGLSELAKRISTFNVSSSMVNARARLQHEGASGSGSQTVGKTNYRETVHGKILSSSVTLRRGAA